MSTVTTSNDPPSTPPATPTRVPDAVLSQWPTLGGGRSRPFGTGLINHTFLVERGPHKAIVQRLHPVFAGTVNEDIDVVTTHLAKKGLPTPRLLLTHEDALWVEHEGHPWRAQTYENGTSVDRVTSSKLAQEAGALVGRFHRAVSDLQHDYRFVRKGVHDTQHHLRVLRDALDAHKSHALYNDVAAIAGPLFDAASSLPDLSTLPLRHAHGDLKISNVLFGAEGRGLCLVDLDTVGKLNSAHELGDALRSWCNPLGEDTDAPTVDATILAAALTGYASSARGLLRDDERASIVPGLITICLELSARFLADALHESYFGWDPTRFATRGEHNLVRARGQWALGRNALAQRAVLDAEVVRAFGA